MPRNVFVTVSTPAKPFRFLIVHTRRPKSKGESVDCFDIAVVFVEHDTGQLLYTATPNKDLFRGTALDAETLNSDDVLAVEDTHINLDVVRKLLPDYIAAHATKHSTAVILFDVLLGTAYRNSDFLVLLGTTLTVVADTPYQQLTGTLWVKVPLSLPKQAIPSSTILQQPRGDDNVKTILFVDSAVASTHRKMHSLHYFFCDNSRGHDFTNEFCWNEGLVVNLCSKVKSLCQLLYFGTVRMKVFQETKKFVVLFSRVSRLGCEGPGLDFLAPYLPSEIEHRLLVLDAGRQESELIWRQGEELDAAAKLTNFFIDSGSDSSLSPVAQYLTYLQDLNRPEELTIFQVGMIFQKDADPKVEEQRVRLLKASSAIRAEILCPEVEVASPVDAAEIIKEKWQQRKAMLFRCCTHLHIGKEAKLAHFGACALLWSFCHLSKLFGATSELVSLVLQLMFEIKQPFPSDLFGAMHALAIKDEKKSQNEESELFRHLQTAVLKVSDRLVGPSACFTLVKDRQRLLTWLKFVKAKEDHPVLLSHPAEGACVLKVLTDTLLRTASWDFSGDSTVPSMTTNPSLTPANHSIVTDENNQSNRHLFSFLGESFIVPQASPLRLPKLANAIRFTVALPSLCLITHVGVFVPNCGVMQQPHNSLQTPLCMTLLAGDYMGAMHPRVVFQNVPLPHGVRQPTVARLSLGPVSEVAGDRYSLCLFSVESEGVREEGLAAFSNSDPVLGRYFTFIFHGSLTQEMLICPVCLFGTRNPQWPTIVGGGSSFDDQFDAELLTCSTAFKASLVATGDSQFEISPAKKLQLLAGCTVCSSPTRAARSDSLTEIGYQHELARVLTSGEKVSVAGLVHLETRRYKEKITATVRDRCLYKLDKPIWLVDPMTRAFPFALLNKENPQSVSTGASCSNPNCPQKRHFFNRKKECKKCGRKFCVDCISPQKEIIFEDGDFTPTGGLCFECAEECHALFEAITQWKQVCSSVPEQFYRPWKMKESNLCFPDREIYCLSNNNQCQVISAPFLNRESFELVLDSSVKSSWACIDDSGGSFHRSSVSLLLASPSALDRIIFEYTYVGNEPLDARGVSVVAVYGGLFSTSLKEYASKELDTTKHCLEIRIDSTFRTRVLNLSFSCASSSLSSIHFHNISIMGTHLRREQVDSQAPLLTLREGTLEYLPTGMWGNNFDPSHSSSQFLHSSTSRAFFTSSLRSSHTLVSPADLLPVAPPGVVFVPAKASELSKLVLQFEFPSPATVCGMMIEGYHPGVAGENGVAEVVRVYGTSASKLTANIAQLTFPVPLMSAGGGRDIPPIMAFSFPRPVVNVTSIFIIAHKTRWKTSSISAVHFGRISFWSTPRPEEVGMPH